MGVVEFAASVLSLLTGLVALAAALAGVTAGSRRRRRESYYRAAADDEASRSPEREAILRSLQREAVGWSIADRAVSKAQLLVPLIGYAVTLGSLFWSGRELGSTLAAGKPVWLDPWDLVFPGTVTGGLVWGTALSLLILLPMTAGIGHYFSERRRIAHDYLLGTTTLSHRPHTGWLFPPGNINNQPADARRGSTDSVTMPRSTDANDTTSATSPGPLGPFVNVRVAVAFIGAAVQMVYFGLVTTAGSQRVLNDLGPWSLLVVLIGAAGMMATFSLFLPLLIGRTSRQWLHPLMEASSPIRTRRQPRPRLTTPRYSRARRRRDHRTFPLPDN